MLADSIPGVKVVKAFAQEHRSRAFDERNTDLRESQMASIKMRALFLPAIAFYYLSRLYHSLVVRRQSRVV